MTETPAPAPTSTSSPSEVDGLSTALQAADRLVASIQEDDQWGGATPCPDWTVRDLVNHLVLGMRLFAGALGDPAGLTLDEVRKGLADQLGEDPLRAYREAAESMLAAFRQPGALDRVITIPFGSVPARLALHLRVVEALVHSWDLARATGQPAQLDEDLAEAELGSSRALLAGMPPGRTPFGPPQPVADDAPASDRLAALLGRDVSVA